MPFIGYLRTRNGFTAITAGGARIGGIDPFRDRGAQLATDRWTLRSFAGRVRTEARCEAAAAKNASTAFAGMGRANR